MKDHFGTPLTVGDVVAYFCFTFESFQNGTVTAVGDGELTGQLLVQSNTSPHRFWALPEILIAQPK